MVIYKQLRQLGQQKLGMSKSTTQAMISTILDGRLVLDTSLKLSGRILRSSAVVSTMALSHVVTSQPETGQWMASSKRMFYHQVISDETVKLLL